MIIAQAAMRDFHFFMLSSVFIACFLGTLKWGTLQMFPVGFPGDVGIVQSVWEQFCMHKCVSPGCLQFSSFS